MLLVNDVSLQYKMSREVLDMPAIKLISLWLVHIWFQLIHVVLENRRRYNAILAWPFFFPFSVLPWQQHIGGLLAVLLIQTY
uniref:Uncharacterized protein n=1 Tax=Anguilla anguilla TaxID=7936 RepID=A0A0E9QSE3_ANGAN